MVRRHLSVFALLMAFAISWTPVASAMQVSAHYAAIDVTGEIWYGFAPSFDIDSRFTRADFYSAVSAWEVQSLTSYVNFTNNDAYAADRTIIVEPIDGKWDRATGDNRILARVGGDDLPCLNNAESCTLTFDVEEPWAVGAIDANHLDFVGIAAHEIGHWIGLEHFGAGVSSDGGNPNTPTMSATSDYGETYKRSISQDDANGLHVARPRFHIMTANDSFEFPNLSPFTGWKFIAGPSGGSATRYCNNSGYNSPCAVQYNGGGGSGAYIYQGIFNQGSAQKTGLRGRARLRNRGTVTSSVNVRVVNTDANVVLAQKSCTLTPTVSGGPWTECITPTFSQPTVPPGGMHIRVINQSNSNFDVDTMIIDW
jgi:hypothetical protein